MMCRLLLLLVAGFGALDIRANDAADGMEANVNSADLSTKLQKLAEHALGKVKIQSLIDDAVFDTRKILDRQDQGREFVEDLAAKLSERLKTRAEAVGEIKRAVQENYASFQTRTTYDHRYPECCKVDPQDLEHDQKLGRPVNLRDICYRIAKDVDVDDYIVPVNEAIYEVMERNHNQYKNLKWQYFGSERGIYVTFPSRPSENCDDYDPRFRPWYVETATPVAKDLVMVIDTSESMRLNMRMNIAKEAAKTVVNTLNPNDRIGLVRFSDEASPAPGNATYSTCYNHNLAYAIRDNKNYLSGYIDTLQPGGSTNYLDAIDKAFELLLNTPDPDGTRKRDKAIVFLTDGEPTGSGFSDILQRITDRNKDVNNKVIIMTYGLGDEIDVKGEQLLKDMANQTYSNETYGDINRGKYTKVATQDHLRYQLGSYYNQFSDVGTLNHSIVTVPYTDFSGLGLVTSICEPVHHDGSLVGVVCVDVRMADIVGDIAYHQHGEFAYSFVIDGTGRAFIHPLLPSQFDSGTEKVFLDIHDLERASGVDSILESMKTGGSGYKSIRTEFYKGNGNVTKQGVTKFSLQATYQWQHIEGTNFSLCMVFSEKDEQVDISVPGNAEHFLFYRFDLKKPSNPCNNLRKLATTETSSVKLTGHAYTDPFRAFYDTFRINDLNNMVNFMSVSDFQWDNWLKKGVKDTVVVTEKMDDFWKANNDEYGKYIIWRYVATFNGVFRLYPGAALPHGYEHFNRPWYDAAIANKDKVMVTVPYVDAFGAGIVVTIAHTILEKNSVHSLEEDMVIGVLGMDIKLNYIEDMVMQMCRPADDQLCFIVDNAGFLVYHPLFMEEGAIVEDVHITKHEPDIATYLIEHGNMVRHVCRGLGDKKLYYTWKLDITVGSLTEQKFVIQKNPDTNLFIGIKTKDVFANTCNCPGWVVNKCRYMDPKSCECPCYTGENKYDYCNNTFSLNSESKISTCIAPKPPTDATPVLEAGSGNDYDPCFDVDCGDYSTDSECNSLVQCKWCASEESSTDQCNESSKCKDPVLPSTPDVTPTGNLEVIIGVVMGCLCFIVIVIIIVLLVVRRRRRLDRQTPEHVFYKVDDGSSSLQPANPPSISTLKGSVIDDPPPPRPHGPIQDHSNRYQKTGGTKRLGDSGWPGDAGGGGRRPGDSVLQHQQFQNRNAYDNQMMQRTIGEERGDSGHYAQPDFIPTRSSRDRMNDVIDDEYITPPYQNNPRPRDQIA